MNRKDKLQLFTTTRRNTFILNTLFYRTKTKEMVSMVSCAKNDENPLNWRKTLNIINVSFFKGSEIISAGRNVYPFTFKIPNMYVCQLRHSKYLIYVYLSCLNVIISLTYLDHFLTEICLHPMRANGARLHTVCELS